MLKKHRFALLLGFYLTLLTPLGASAAQPTDCKIVPGKSAFRICGLKKWYLIGNALTPGEHAIKLIMDSVAANVTVDVLLNNRKEGELVSGQSGLSDSFDISQLAPGKHTLLFKIKGKPEPIYQWTFYRSHPLYALLTTDWDTSDSKNSVLKRHNQLHKEHPGLKITHFFGPYTFTDPAVSPVRRTYLVNWLKQLRDNYKDEIGLHIHPYCNFVSTVPGIPCRIKPSDTYNKGDSSGYTVLSSAYSEPEFLRLLQAADGLFIQNGLEKPVVFRTGSWAANASTLNALAADQFVADSSANNWLRIKDESEHDGNGVLYSWNKKNWHTINDQSQPYFPAQAEPTQSGSPAIHILEVPDNGSMVDYVTSTEMISIFTSNLKNSTLNQPATYVFGFHPMSYDQAFHQRIQKTLRYIDRHLAGNDGGPVVYETLSHMRKVFASDTPYVSER